MDGLASPKNEAPLKHLPKDTDLGGLKFWVQRQVGMIKVPEYAVPLETPGLLLDCLPRKGGRPLS
jgi:hypothetical protein